MTLTPRTIRIFISSPGDVVEERDGARRVVEGLQRMYPGTRLLPVLWEELALPATASFQETIDFLIGREPIDVAVFILWSRLGSPLGAAITRPDGTPYRSGTERELDLMLTAFEQSGRQRPVILAYARDDDAAFKQRLTELPTSQLEEFVNQRKLAEAFIIEQFHDAEGRNLRAYQTYREPVGFVQRLRLHLRNVIDDLLGADAAPSWTEEPYRGLEVFDVCHAAIFHGREEETCQLLQRLRDQEQAGCAFAVIVGASGSGKSSLARAGVAANLVQYAGDDDSTRWHAVTFIPALAAGHLCAALVRLIAEQLPHWNEAANTLDDIAESLAENAALTVRLSIAPAFSRASDQAGRKVRLLLVLDQLEELWTDRHTTSQDRECFFAAIEALASSGYVVVLATLRSDFYHHAQEMPIFLRLKGRDGHYDLLPPDATSIQRLITEPARLAGLRFERNEKTGRSLDEVIFQDAARDPHALPLLEYTLAELYRQRDEGRRLMTFAAYVELGGVEGAIGKRADETFATLPPEAQAALDDILPLLVSVDIAGEQSAVRRRASETELTSTPARKTLVDRLVAARFLTTDRQDDTPIASFAHEALLRRWDRIVNWISVNREQLRLRSRVEQTQQRWEEQDRNDSLLLAEGLPLDEGRQLLNQAPYLLTPTTSDYIHASIAYYERKAKQSRRQRAIVLSTIAALLVVMIAGGLVMRRSRQLELTESLVNALSNARGISVPYIIKDLKELPREMAIEELDERFDVAEDLQKLPLAFALANFGDVHTDYLVSRLEGASPDEANNFLDALGRAREKALGEITTASAACDSKAAKYNGNVSETATEKFDYTAWRQKARLAMLSLQLGDSSLAAEMCRPRADPIQRTVFIDEGSSWCGDLIGLRDVAQEINDADLQSAICLVVGSVPPNRVMIEQRNAWESLLTDWHQRQRDTGTHSASGWALRKWGLPLPQLPVGKPDRSEEQQQRIDRLAAEVADTQQQIADAEQELVRSQAAHKELVSKPKSVAVFPGDEAHLAPSGTEAAVSTGLNGNKKPLSLHDLGSSQDRELREFAWDPAISPGTNKLIAMISDLPNAAEREVLIFDAENDIVRVVGRGSYPSWSSTGSKLFFQDITSKTVMSFDVTKPDANPEPLIDQIPSYYPAVSPDATKVAFFASGEIRVLDVATRKMIANHVIPGWRGALPGWAPDNRHVGFGSYANGDERGLWILDSETGKCFMAVPGNATRPSWSSDGSRMLYENRVEHEIHVVEWSAEQQQLLADEHRSQEVATEKVRQLSKQLAEAQTELFNVIWNVRANWLVNSVGLTMLRISPRQVSNEKGYTIEVSENVFLSDREISVGLFQQFIDDSDYPAAEKPKDWKGVDVRVSPTSAHPAQQVSWYDAVLYCNWLSNKEGRAPCYQRTGEKDKDFAGKETEDDAWRLDVNVSGYRLPTEAEWEYACRAGTATAFLFGDDKAWLDTYGVSRSEKAEACGTKLPNAWGLFDVHGNVWEWCDDAQGWNRVNRGGSWFYDAAFCRSAGRFLNRPTYRSYDCGFRVALVLQR